MGTGRVFTPSRKEMHPSSVVLLGWVTCGRVEMVSYSGTVPILRSIESSWIVPGSTPGGSL